MRSVKSLLAAGAATLISSMAFAADMPIAAPPPMYAPPAPPADFGGWYLRGDIVMTNQSAKRIDSATAQTFPTQTVGLGFDSSPLFDLGVGYRFNNWFRTDVIGQYRGKANLHGSDNVTLSATDFEANNYSGHVEIRLKEGANAQKLLHEAAAVATIYRFELVEPSLEEIFIQTVGGKADA